MLTRLDTKLFYFINQKMACDVFDFIMPLFARHEDWFLVCIVAVSIMLYTNLSKGLIAVLLCSLAVALNDSAIHFFLKPFWGRPRPCSALPNDTFRLLVGCGESFSFPSQHAGNMFAIASIIGWKYKHLSIFILAAAFMVAVSRVYLGVHFPFDVACGALIGAGWGGIILYMEYLVKRSKLSL